MNNFKNNNIEPSDVRQKMRIAHIFNHSYFLGGGEISFFELIRKLETKGKWDNSMDEQITLVDFFRIHKKFLFYQSEIRGVKTIL